MASPAAAVPCLDPGGVDGVLGGGRGDLAAVEPQAELHAEEQQQDDRGEDRRVGGDLAAVVPPAAGERAGGASGQKPKLNRPAAAGDGGQHDAADGDGGDEHEAGPGDAAVELAAVVGARPPCSRAASGLEEAA